MSSRSVLTVCWRSPATCRSAKLNKKSFLWASRFPSRVCKRYATEFHCVSSYGSMWLKELVPVVAALVASRFLLVVQAGDSEGSIVRVQ